MTPRARRARVTGLALCTLLGAGLAVLHVTSAPARLSVPHGARAGELLLRPCSYATERGSYPADCGTLVVRENRHDPRSRLIALPIKRIRARSIHPGLPLFRLEGGPGLSNLHFAAASRYAGDHDVVLVGYRGVDGSSRLDCPEVVAARESSHDLLSAATERSTATAYRACAGRLQREGVDLAGYSLPARVDDLDLARRRLGYRQVDLLSESAGTRTAMIYAWRYPRAIHRSIMVGVNPPGHFVWDAAGTGAELRRYAALCAANRACHLRTPHLAPALTDAFAHVPARWGFLPIKRGNVQAGAFFGLMHATEAGGGPLNGPATVDSLLAARRGDASGAWLMSLAAQLLFPRAQVWGDVASVGRTDAAAARRLFAARAERGSLIGSPGTELVWAGGRLLDAWPRNPDESLYARVRDSQVETLLVGGSLDLATPPQNAARELLPHLPRGRQVVLSNLGHTGDFWTYQPAASTRLIERYLATGRVDTSLYRHHVLRFDGASAQRTAAKAVLCTLLGLATLTALWLPWLVWRIQRRGQLGRRSAAVLRVLGAPLLGLGGWCAGALVALIALPGVPVTDPLLVSVSVGLPVGVAIACGWLVRGRGAAGLAGVSAAAGSALLGAWLGFHVPANPLLGALTAVAGSVLAANAAVLAVDLLADPRRDPAHAPAPAIARWRPSEAPE